MRTGRSTLFGYTLADSGFTFQFSLILFKSIALYNTLLGVPYELNQKYIATQRDRPGTVGWSLRTLRIWKRWRSAKSNDGDRTSSFALVEQCYIISSSSAGMLSPPFSAPTGKNAIRQAYKGRCALCLLHTEDMINVN